MLLLMTHRAALLILVLCATLFSAVPSYVAAQDSAPTEAPQEVTNATDDIAVKERLKSVTDEFKELGATALRLMPLLLIALIIVVLFWFAGGWLSRRSSWLQRLGLSELGALLGKRVIRLVVTLIGLIIALELLNATALFSAVLGVAGVFGIALGFAFRNIIENYLAGILLSARNPFRIGDLIQVGEFTGNVVRLTSRDTVLMTLDGNHLRIPNSVIITSSMTNFSLNPLRRFDFYVDITPDADLSEARQITRDVLRRMTGVLAEPAPQCLIQELGASTIVLRVLGWVDQGETDLLKARSEAIRLVKQAFDTAAIEMPEPTYRLRMGASLPETQTSRVPETRDEEPEQTDVSVDRSIDKQVSDDLAKSDEQNLLKK